jgi:GNAT superfamily N-acetyltransferase
VEYIATDPAYAGRGAASKLIEWGLKKSLREGKIVYLESTVEAAPMYEKKGFVPVDILMMDLPRARGRLTGVYIEICYVYVPPVDQQLNRGQTARCLPL